MSTPLTHTTVLLHEAVDAWLGAAPAGDGEHDGAGGDAGGASGCFVDATFGRGGHSRLALSRMAATAQLIAFDKDAEAIAEAGRVGDARFSIRHEGFAALGELPPGSVAGVLMDLGVSSPQIDNPARGFSFRFDGPLDMRMDTSRGLSVADWLATAETQQIAEVIRDYGEERFAVQVAKAIVARRQERGPISTT
ncbi:MAG: 16S rRNA (cytosine(1402)-N(4))-methyltransferase, partial [Comamonadaceae bacterium]